MTIIRNGPTFQAIVFSYSNLCLYKTSNYIYMYKDNLVLKSFSLYQLIFESCRHYIVNNLTFNYCKHNPFSVRDESTHYYILFVLFTE